MSKHTPGPWLVDKHKNGGFDVIAPTAGHNGNVLVLCSRQEYSGRAREMWANASLISAAPQLLEALQDIMDTGFAGGPQGKRARSAIKKATGE